VGVAVVVDRDLGEVHLVGGLRGVEGAPTWSEWALVHHTDRLGSAGRRSDLGLEQFHARARIPETTERRNRRATRTRSAGLGGSLDVRLLRLPRLCRSSAELAVVVQRQIEQGITDRAWSGCQHEFAANATRVEQTAADIDFDSPLMRLAASARTN
jgi:hypothetical protein